MMTTVLLSLGLAWAGSPKSFSRLACETHLDTKTIRRLERAITRVLPVGAGPLVPERKRLREMLVAYSARYVRNLDLKRAEQFFNVLENARTGEVTVVRDGRLVTSDEDTIELAFDDHVGLYLHLGDRARRSLLGYLQLLHELSHLSRVVSGATDPAEQIAQFKAGTLRWLGIYREEVLSTRDEYAFLRWACPPVKLVKMERVVNETRALARTPDDFEQVRFNQEFLVWANRALTSSKRDFVRAAVPLSQYRVLQSNCARERWRTRYVARVGRLSPWLARKIDHLTRDLIHLLDRPPLMTKDSSSRW